MNIFENKKDKKSKNYTESERMTYEGMIEAREAKMPEFQKTIEELFENWSGSPIAIVIVDEDENGDPTGTQRLMLGGGSPAAQVRLSVGLGQASDEAMVVLAKGIASMDNTKDMLSATEQVIDYMEALKKSEKKGEK